MSRRRERAARLEALEQAEEQATRARTAARKAFDLKDPRFLGEAAVAATRGPVGLALFGASRGVQVLRERRAEQAQILGDLAADAREHAEALRERTADLVEPQPTRGPLRRLAPLWIIGLVGGAAVAGAAAYFLRDQGPASSGAAPSPGPAGGVVPVPAPEATGVAPGDGADIGADIGAVAGASAEAVGDEAAAHEEATGADLTMESPDPEGPADQTDGTSPAAGASAPGPAAGSAPQPSDDGATSRDA